MSAQSRFSLTDRAQEPVLDAAEQAGIAFIPWFPLATGDLAEPGGPVDEIARAHDATPAQVALAWLLQRSPGDAARSPAPRRSSTSRRTSVRPGFA